MTSKVLMKLLVIGLCLTLFAACSTGTVQGTSQSVSPPSDSADEPNTSETDVLTGNKVGNKAPEFELLTQDGESVSLNELRGKPVLLNFFATWCGPCMAEMPDIQKIYEEYGDSIHVLCIDVGETAEIVENFLSEGSYSFPVALDSENVTTELYGLHGIPQTYVLDSEGIIAWHKLGSSDYKTFAAELDTLL